MLFVWTFWKFYTIICWVKQYFWARTHSRAHKHNPAHKHTHTHRQATLKYVLLLLLLPAAPLLLLLLLTLLFLFLCFGTNSFIHFHYTRPHGGTINAVSSFRALLSFNACAAANCNAKDYLLFLFWTTLWSPSSSSPRLARPYFQLELSTACLAESERQRRRSVKLATTSAQCWQPNCFHAKFGAFHSTNGGLNFLIHYEAAQFIVPFLIILLN